MNCIYCGHPLDEDGRTLKSSGGSYEVGICSTCKGVIKEKTPQSATLSTKYDSTRTLLGTQVGGR